MLLNHQLPLAFACKHVTLRPAIEANGFLFAIAKYMLSSNYRLHSNAVLSVHLRASTKVSLRVGSHYSLTTWEKVIYARGVTLRFIFLSQNNFPILLSLSPFFPRSPSCPPSLFGQLNSRENILSRFSTPVHLYLSLDASHNVCTIENFDKKEVLCK